MNNLSFSNIKESLKIHFKVYLILFFSIVVSTIFYGYCSSIYMSKINESNIIHLKYENLTDKSEYFFVIKDDLFSINKGKETIDAIPYIDLGIQINYSNNDFSVGQFVSGCAITNDFSNINLLEGTYPTNSEEVIISDVCYQQYKELGYKIGDSIKIFPSYKLVGVYKTESSELDSTFLNRVMKNLEADIENDANSLIIIRAQYTFAYEGAYTYSDLSDFDNHRYYLIKNTVENRQLYKDTFFPFISGFAAETVLFDNNLHYIYSNKVLFGEHTESLAFYSQFLILIAYLVMITILTIKIQFKDENEDVRPNILAFIFTSSLGIVVGYLLLSLVVLISNAIISTSQYLVFESYILIDSVSFTVILGFTIIAIIIFALSICIKSMISKKKR